MGAIIDLTSASIWAKGAERRQRRVRWRQGTEECDAQVKLVWEGERRGISESKSNDGQFRRVGTAAGGYIGMSNRPQSSRALRRHATYLSPPTPHLNSNELLSRHYMCIIKGRLEDIVSDRYWSTEARHWSEGGKRKERGARMNNWTATRRSQWSISVSIVGCFLCCCFSFEICSSAVFQLQKVSLKEITIKPDDWRNVSVNSDKRKTRIRSILKRWKVKCKRHFHTSHLGNMLKRKSRVCLYLLHNRCTPCSAVQVAWVT